MYKERESTQKGVKSMTGYQVYNEITCKRIESGLREIGLQMQKPQPNNKKLTEVLALLDAAWKLLEA